MKVEPGSKRTYRMVARAAAVDATRARILQAAFDLWLAHPYDDVTLDRVAATAGVAKPTVLRQFGSKDALATAVAAWHQPREQHARAVAAGDVAGALQRLMDRYELMGDANVRLLELEHRVPPIRRILQAARAGHRAWVEHVFAPFLPTRQGPPRERRVMAFYAATEVMVWKLLRRDFGLGRDETAAVLRELVEALVPRAEDTTRTARQHADAPR